MGNEVKDSEETKKTSKTVSTSTADILKNDTAKFHDIYRNYHHHFKRQIPHGFHNMLWQIMVNAIHGDALMCFYATFNDQGKVLAIVLANKPNYQIGSFFMDDMQLDDCETIATELNEKVFGIDDDTAMKIVGSSMHAINS